jgi:hypothetical protein
MANYTQANLARLDDAAVKGGFSEWQEARFANDELGLEVTRGFEAGPDGLELLVFSMRAPGDAEIVPDFFEEASTL